MTAGAAVAAAFAGAAVHLALGRPRGRVGASATAGRLVVATGVLVAAASVAVLDGTDLVLVLLVVGVTAAVLDELRRRRRLVLADRRADQVLAVCEALVADLQAGQPPVTALGAATADWPELGPAAAAAELGADVPAALRELARRPGADQLRIVAAAWQVGHRSGAGLAGALATAALRLREDRATARVVATEMAAATATARMLAGLPVAVLLLGNGVGGDPVGFLLDTPLGLACLCSGLALEYAGLRWLARIADHAAGRRSR